MFSKEPEIEACKVRKKEGEPFQGKDKEKRVLKTLGLHPVDFGKQLKDWYNYFLNKIKFF